MEGKNFKFNYFLILIIVFYLNQVNCGMMSKMKGKSKDKGGCPELDEMDTECAFADMCPSCPCPSPCGAAMPTMAPMMPMMPMMPPMMPPMMGLMTMMAAKKARARMTHALTQVAARAIRRHVLVKRSVAAVSSDVRRSNRIERVSAFFIDKPSTLSPPSTMTSLMSVPISKRSLRLKRQMPPNPMQVMMVAMMIMNMIFPGLGNIMYNAMAYGTAMARLKKTKKMSKKAAKRQWKEGKMRVMLRMMNGQLPVPQDFAENAYTTYEFPTMQGQMEVPSMIPGAGQMGVGDYLGVLQMLNGARRRR